MSNQSTQTLSEKDLPQEDTQEKGQQDVETILSLLTADMARSVRQAMQAYDQHPRDARDLVALLENQRAQAWEDLRLRLENSYVNRELGEARQDYVDILQNRHRKAHDALAAVNDLMKVGLTQAAQFDRFFSSLSA